MSCSKPCSKACKNKSDEKTISVKTPSTFWTVLGTLILWPVLTLAGLVIMPVATVCFIVLAIATIILAIPGFVVGLICMKIFVWAIDE